MEQLIILGAGGFAREILWVAREINAKTLCWDILGFIDEDPKNHGKILCGLPVLGGFGWFDDKDTSNIKVICGIGSPQTKEHFVEQAHQKGLKFATLIYPDIQMSEFVEIGEGTIITAGNIITTQVKIGNHVLVNLACTIGHDTVIEDYCTLAPHCTISGYAHIAEGTELGSAVTTLPGKKIGQWSIIGAGAVVTKDIPDKVLAVGIPAEVKKNLV